MSCNSIQIVTDLYEAFNRRDLARWVGGFADEAIWLNVPTNETFVGPDGQGTNYANWNQPFPEGKCVDLVVRGNETTVVVEFAGDGVNTGPLPGATGPLPPTGRRVRVQFCDVHELRGDKIVRTHRYWDQLSVHEQMGL